MAGSYAGYDSASADAYRLHIHLREQFPSEWIDGFSYGKIACGVAQAAIEEKISSLVPAFLKTPPEM